MARPRTGTNLNIAQLEQILSDHRSTVARLEAQRSDLQRELNDVNSEIARIGGTPGEAVATLAVTAIGKGKGKGKGRAGTRAHNAKSLPEMLEDVMRKVSGPMKVGDITKAVEAAGYRSTSDNFRAIVNQTLIKERKRFTSTGERGTYQLKKM